VDIFVRGCDECVCSQSSFLQNVVETFRLVSGLATAEKQSIADQELHVNLMLRMIVVLEGSVLKNLD